MLQYHEKIQVATFHLCFEIDIDEPLSTTVFLDYLSFFIIHLNVGTLNSANQIRTIFGENKTGSPVLLISQCSVWPADVCRLALSMRKRR